MKDKKEIFQWIGISLIVLLFLALTGLAIYSLVLQAEGVIPPAPTPPSDGYYFENSQVDDTEGIIINNVQEEGITLEISPVNLGSGSADTAFEKNLQATVTPYDAPDKTVDWSVSWSPDASRIEETVTNYITVTPTSDGSAMARVKCLKGFEGDKVIVTVTTRVGGFKANCQVEYKGIPQTFVIDTTGKTVKTDTAWNLSMVELSCGSTYNFDLKADNELHAVGSTYNNYSLSMSAAGSITVDIKTHTNSTGNDAYTTGTEIISIGDLFSSDGYIYSYIPAGGGMLSVIEARIVNGKLQIQAKDALSSYYAITGNRNGYQEKTFKNYTDGKTPYCTVTVTETTSGLSHSIRIKTIATVNAVSVSSAGLTF